MYKRKKVILLLTFLIYIIIMFILGLIFICDNVSNGESTVIRYHKFSSNKSTNYEIILTKINDDPEFDVQNGKNGDASAKLYRWWVGTTTVTYSVDVQVSIPKGYTLVSGPTNEGEFSLSASGWGSSETYTTIHECSFSANKYSVKFDGNGNTSGSMSNQSFTYDQAQNLTANGYSKIGYSFAGWSTSANGSVEYSNSQSVSNLTSTNNETVTLYAVWTANTYTVTLNKQSGSGGSSSVTATYNSAMPAITTPSRTGYSFQGYYTGTIGSGTKYYDNNGKSARNWDKASDTTLFAYWEANGYTLTMNANGGSISSNSNWTGSGSSVTKTVKYDSQYGTLPTSSNISRTGYTFDNWWTSGSGGSRVYTTTVMNSTSGATIYAHWTPNIYKITLDKQSGSGGTNEIYLKYNTAWCSNSSGTATITSITKPTRTGYTFGGYYTDKNGAGTQIINASGSITGSKTYIASADTLYAKWTANTYSIVYDANGGSGSMSNQSMTYDKASNLTTNTYTRQGYYFVGWKIDYASAGIFKDSTGINGTNGSVEYWADYMATEEPIPFVNNTGNDIVLTSNYIVCGIYAYDANGILIKRCSSYATVHNIPTGTSFIRIEINKSNLSFAQVDSLRVFIEKQYDYKDEASVNNLATSGSVTLYAVWLDTWANHVTTPTGSGSSTSPYIIDSAEDLAWMINNHGSALKYFKQTKVINLSKYNWYPIGTSDKPFKGVYNGQGYEITNLNIPEITNASENKIQSDIGLFGYTSGGEITGIYIKNATIYGKDNVGLIVSNATSTKINSNIIESSKINASGNYGAVAGKISGGEIKYNLVYVTTNGGTSTSSLYTGSTTLSTNLVENNGTRSKVGTEDITGWGKVFNRLLPPAISWGAKVTPATSSDLTNWVDKKID